MTPAGLGQGFAHRDKIENVLLVSPKVGINIFGRADRIIIRGRGFPRYRNVPYFISVRISRGPCADGNNINRQCAAVISHSLAFALTPALPPAPAPAPDKGEMYCTCPCRNVYIFPGMTH